jgi:hypothetical protein
VIEQGSPIEPSETKPSDAMPLLISTRRRAVIALCLAGYFAARKYWYLLISHHPDPYGWIFSFNSLWPNRVVAVLNLRIYGVMIWLLIVVLTRLRNEERIFCAVWIAEPLVSPIGALVPKIVACGVLWAQFFGDIVMLVAVVILYRKNFGRRPC